MQTEELRILLALEPTWTVSINGQDFQTVANSDIEVTGSWIRFGRFVRLITDIQWLRESVVRLRARQRFRAQADVLTLYPGERLPSIVDLRRRRRAFQTRISGALTEYFGTRRVERQTLYSDKRHGIGGAYPRFVAGPRAAIAVDPDESSAVVNGIMRAAILWAPLARRRVAVVVPEQRRATIVNRLKFMPRLRESFDWLQWSGERVSTLSFEIADPQTHVQTYAPPQVHREVARICAMAPNLLQPVQSIVQKAVSIRIRGIEIACVTDGETRYPMGEPLEPLIQELAEKRRYGSSHALSRAHEEQWLESNLIAQMREALPSADVSRIYPQVPSFIGEERNIVDLLTVTEAGRLGVIEVKASSDPDLPFQAFDYWLAVERHRKAGDFERAGYFEGVTIRNKPALLVLVAPLLSFHKSYDRLVEFFPRGVPLMQVGIDQAWKRKIKILRRQGLLG